METVVVFIALLRRRKAVSEKSSHPGDTALPVDKLCSTAQITEEVKSSTGLLCVTNR